MRIRATAPLAHTQLTEAAPSAASLVAPVRARPGLNGSSKLAGLLSKAADGDPCAWTEITQRYTRLLWAVARSYRLSSEDSADVVQNTWLRLLENLQGIDNPDALPGWLATTARREAIGVLRRRARDVIVPSADDRFNAADTNALETDAALLEDERDAQLWRCFGQLGERDQRLLRVLVASDRPSYPAVAAALEMPVGSIGPTRMRALKRLEAIIAASDYPFRIIDVNQFGQSEDSRV
jgi:RNA polymerase sigma factor (sigma-70 family)